MISSKLDLTSPAVNHTKTLKIEWFSRAINLLLAIHEGGASLDQKKCAAQMVALKQQIEELARRKSLSRSPSMREIPNLAEHTLKAVLNAPNEKRIDCLISSTFFRLMICKRSMPLNTKDQQFNREKLVPMQLRGYAERRKVDVQCIASNTLARDWLSAVNEVVKTPEELKGMRETLSLIPQDFIEKTQMERMALAPFVNSKADCDKLISSLKQSAKNNSKASEAYNCFILSAPSHLQAALKQNLILSLQIRARQFP